MRLQTELSSVLRKRTEQ